MLLKVLVETGDMTRVEQSVGVTLTGTYMATATTQLFRGDVALPGPSSLTATVTVS